MIMIMPQFSVPPALPEAAAGAEGRGESGQNFAGMLAGLVRDAGRSGPGGLTQDGLAGPPRSGSNWLPCTVPSM